MTLLDIFCFSFIRNLHYINKRKVSDYILTKKKQTHFLFRIMSTNESCVLKLRTFYSLLRQYDIQSENVND